MNFRSVAQTPFDFRSAKTIGQDIEMEDDQLLKGAGYDHCWVLNGSGMRQVSSVYHPEFRTITGDFLQMNLVYNSTVVIFWMEAWINQEAEPTFIERVSASRHNIILIHPTRIIFHRLS